MEFPLPQATLLAAATAMTVWALRARRLGARKRAKAALRWVRRGQPGPGGANGPGG